MACWFLPQLQIYLGSVYLYQLRWVSEVVHLNTCPILRSTINITANTHTELPVSILNGQLLTECESTVGLHGGDGKKSICVCVCVQAKGERMRESVREREKKTMVEWKKQAGCTVFIRCQHVFIIFCWIRLLKSMGVVRTAVGLTVLTEELLPCSHSHQARLLNYVAS